MKFLFIGQGYPDVPGTTSGSGIGTYLREITLGLVARGHECDVIVWRSDDGGRTRKDGGSTKVEQFQEVEGTVASSPSPVRRLLPTLHSSLFTFHFSLFTVHYSLFTVHSGVRVFLLGHAYWPLVERVLPDSRDVWNLRRLVRRLDAQHHYDRIEIQSEEGIGIGVQRDFSDRVILRIHTTLEHMVEIKEGGGEVEGAGFRVQGSGCGTGACVGGKVEGGGWRGEGGNVEHRTSNVERRTPDARARGEWPAGSGVGVQGSGCGAGEGGGLRVEGACAGGRVEGRGGKVEGGSVEHRISNIERRTPNAQARGERPICGGQPAVSRSRFPLLSSLFTRHSSLVTLHSSLLTVHCSLFTAHSSLSPDSLPWKTRYRLWRERRSFLLAKRILTHSRAHAEELMERFPGTAEPAVVLHGIGKAEERGQRTEDGEREDPVFPKSEPGTRNCEPSIPTFLLVGSLDRRKGFDRLRPILDAYAAAYGPCKAVLVTSGGNIDAEASRLGLPSTPECGRRAPRADTPEMGPDGGEDRSLPQGSGAIERGWTVEWRCGLDAAHMAAAYREATVYLHLARYESFGLPLIEAAAAAVPVVSTDVGVARELLHGALAGCIVDGDDAGAAAAVLHRLIYARSAVGRRVHNEYLSRFTRGKMTNSWLGAVG